MTLISRNSPVSRSSFVRSNFCSTYISGLKIGLLDQDYVHNPVDIINTYLSDPNFDAFLDITRRYGFMINKNIPWELVADLDSPTMLDYAKRYGLLSKQEIFQKAFYKIHETDIDVLKSIIVSVYNTFITNQRQVENVNIQNSLDISRLQPMTVEMLDRQYSMEYFIRLYSYFKFLESKVSLSQNEFENYCIEANKLYKFIGINQSLLFINKKCLQLVAEQKNYSRPSLTDPDDLVRLLEQQKESHAVEQITF
jgi:hypothetical protein